MRVLILGGTGFIGPRVANHLAEGGHEVAVLHRGRTEGSLAANIEHLHCPRLAYGSRASDEDFARYVSGRRIDVLLDMIPLTEQDARAVLALVPAETRIVAISSQDVYRAYGILLGIEAGEPEAVPLDEDAPLRTRLHPYQGEKPRAADDPRHWLDDYEKILIERAYRDGSATTTILRLPMVYGPGDRQHRLYEHLRPMQDGRPRIVLDEGLAAWRWTRGYVENVAAAVTLAVTDPNAVGRTYNVGEPEALSMAEWVGAIGAAANWEGRVLLAPREELPASLRATMRTEQDLVTSSSRIRAELGYQETVPRGDALRLTVEWELAHPPESQAEQALPYEDEDAYLKRLRDRDVPSGRG